MYLKTKITIMKIVEVFHWMNFSNPSNKPLTYFEIHFEVKNINQT